MLFIDFHDIDYSSKYVRCTVKLSRFGGRFRDAQRWLDEEILKKMSPYVPRKTGNLVSYINSMNQPNIGTGYIRASAIYGDKLYPGINPKTGAPWRWTNPQTQPYWGQFTIKAHRLELIQGVKNILLKGKF